ncbi:MAG: branched-chain amino acid ABC transporter permease [Lachnospiraceae bacterium]|nr:branched-chain amino acid ABC transporter permease [Lachnospiraceae bacterium]
MADKNMLKQKDAMPKVRWISLAVAVVVLVSLPFWGGDYIVNIFTLILMYMAIGEMWNLLGGYAGLVSLGSQAFIGLGGYSLAIVSQVLKLPFLLGFLLAAIVSVIFALLISFPIFNMKDVYFTIGTWLVAEALCVFFQTWGFVNYNVGFNITVARTLGATAMYFIAFGVAVIALLAVVLILRSKFGLGLMAMRDNEAASEIRGVKLYRSKLICFLISAAITGLAGAALYLNLSYIKPTVGFSIDWTVSMVFIAVIGGMGTIEGPIIGAIVFVILRQLLYNFSGFSMLILGVIAVVMILVAPKGIMGLINKKSGFDLFGVKRKVKISDFQTNEDN